MIKTTDVPRLIPRRLRNALFFGVQWYLSGLLAWTVWANQKLVLVFWGLANPFCRACHDLNAFIIVSLWIGLTSLILSTAESRQLHLKAAPYVSLLIGIGLLLPSVFRFPHAEQIWLLSLVLAFNLSLIIKKWPNIKISWPARVILVIGIVFWYGLLSWQRWQFFHYPARDAGVFHQAIWYLANGEVPSSSIKGLANLWGDHFHPVLVAFVPFYRLGGFFAVLLAQAAFIGIGVLAVISLVGKLTNSACQGIVFGLSYGIYFGFQESIAFGFYPEIVIPGSLAFAFYGLLTKRWLVYWSSVILALTCKEDVGIYLIFLGFIAWYVRQSGLAVKTIVIGVIWFSLTTQWLIPKLGRGEYQYAPTVGWSKLLNPLFLFRQLTFPPIKIETVMTTLASFGFIPLMALIWLIPAIPMVLERFIPEVLNRWTSGFHYSLPLAPVLILASVQGCQALKKKYPCLLGVNAAVFWPSLLLASSFLLTVLEHRPLTRLKGDQLNLSLQTRLLTSYLTRIPPESSLAATNALVPHLAGRERIYALPTLTQPEYIVIDASLNIWPLNLETLDHLKASFIEQGYQPLIKTSTGAVYYHPRQGW